MTRKTVDSRSLAAPRRAAALAAAIFAATLARAEPQITPPAAEGATPPAPPVQPADPAALAEQSYAEALAFYTKGKGADEPLRLWLRTCEEKFEDVIIAHPGTDGALAALYCRSLCQSRQNRIEIAIEGLIEFRGHASDYVPAARGTLLLADCYSKLRSWEKAIALREEVLGANGAGEDAPETLYSLGRDLRDLGKLDDAKNAWARLHEGFPESKAAERATAKADTLKPPAARLQPLRAKLQREFERMSARRGKDQDDGSVFERIEALLLEVGEIHAPEAEQYLLKLFNSGPPEARQLVIKPLLAVASQASLKGILRQLPKLEPHVQRDFLEHTQPFQLEGLPLEEQFRPWLAEGAEPAVKSAALLLLGRIGTLAATNLLLDCLERTEPIDITYLERPEIRYVVGALRDLRRAEALDRLAVVLRDANETMLRRTVAATALGASRHAEGTAALAAIVGEMNGATLTLAALDSLKRRRAASAADAILRGLVLRKDQHVVRQVAIETLVQLDAPLASEPLLALGSITEQKFRLLWIGLVAKNAHRDECVARLIGALADPVWQIREVAIQASAAVRKIEVIDALIARLAVEEPALASTIGAALAALTGENLGADALLWRDYWSVARPRWQALEDEARKVGSFVRGGSGRTAVYYGLEVTGKHVVFLIDGSASMKLEITVPDHKGGETTLVRMALAREELAAALSKLPPDVEFNVVIFQEGVKPLWPVMQKATGANIDRANAFVRSIEPGGATNIFDALELAMKLKYIETIFLLSDGDPTAGKILEPEDIIEELMRLNRERKVAIHTIALGTESDFLARLARLNFGRSVRAGTTPAPAK
ncbi:MAG: VWA domain-containing protein [Planctomycetes bacterium]|nr:VWA domain-containing protein [Planctomycetota bacterium]